MNIKDYLHLYLGCECVIGDLNWKPETNLHNLAPGIDVNYGKPIKTTLDAHALNVFSHEVKLILRPIKSITKKEIKEWQEISATISDDRIHAAEEIRWSLSKGFDLFGLIDAGLAIDKTKLKTLKQKKV